MAPYNGSGTFSLAEPAFIPSTTIVSADMNSDLSDIATGLSLCLTTDGQSTMTAGIKGFSGTVSLPGYAFASDLDCGMYRIGANNIGLAVAGAKVLDIATTGLGVTGTLNSTGNFSVATTVFTVAAASGNTVVGGTLAVTGVVTLTAALLAASGTVGAPGMAFSADADCGWYRIGTNNIGAAVNGAKVLDVATTGLGVTGLISATTTITAGTGLVATTSVTGATVAGAMVATQAQQETGTATDLIVTPGRQKNNPLHPKAWATVNAAGTIVVGSGISGVVQDSTGDWTVTMTTAMSTANYGVVVIPNSTQKVAMNCNGRTSSTVFTVKCWLTSTNADTDPTDFTVIVTGDQ